MARENEIGSASRRFRLGGGTRQRATGVWRRANTGVPSADRCAAGSRS